ncbi:MAG: pantoate--beta-alanine ligase [Alphaproteobacteria bacterium]|nr:pantoate--beta-alanine ligase [Alphaproteobacteria bacterium]
MNIVSDIQQWREIRRSLKGSVGFVPTMGHLHEGHASLCTRADAENDIVAASIFVNPTQFNQPSDFEQYQRTLEADCRLLESLGVDYVFCPSKEDMYPDGYEVQVSETKIAGELEGEFRPGHFTGMLTVVLKLLNLAQADRAYFGEKDFQQLLLVKKMAAALFLPVEIVACATVRAENGLALSSRNARLDAGQRRKAAELAQLLMSDLSDDEVKKQLELLGFRPEYVATRWGRRLGAAWLDKVRLIDNVPFVERNQKNAAVS